MNFDCYFKIFWHGKLGCIYDYLTCPSIPVSLHRIFDQHSAPDKTNSNQYRTGQIWSESVLAQFGIPESVSTLQRRPDSDIIIMYIMFR